METQKLKCVYPFAVAHIMITPKTALTEHRYMYDTTFVLPFYNVLTTTEDYDRRLHHIVLTHFNKTTQETTDGSTVNIYFSQY